MKALILDDNAIKSAKISRALRRAGFERESAGDVQTGLEMIDRAYDDGCPYDVVVTDMHYPMKPLSDADWSAGNKLLEFATAKHPDCRVIIVSSLRYEIPEAYGCIWYQDNDTSNWDEELTRLARTIK